jgi:hypothetical protein
LSLYLFGLSLSCLVLYYLVVVLSCLVLSCGYLILFCFVLSCLVFFLIVFFLVLCPCPCLCLCLVIEEHCSAYANLIFVVFFVCVSDSWHSLRIHLRCKMLFRPCYRFKSPFAAGLWFLSCAYISFVFFICVCLDLDLGIGVGNGLILSLDLILMFWSWSFRLRVVWCLVLSFAAMRLLVFVCSSKKRDTMMLSFQTFA